MTDVRMFTTLAAVLAGLGVALLVQSTALAAHEVLARVRVYRLSPTVRRLRRYRGEDASLPTTVLYGVPDVPWEGMAAGCAVAGAVTLGLLAGPLFAVVGPVLGGVPLLARRMLRAEGEARLRLAVRDFVDDLREAVALHGALGPALEAVTALRQEQSPGDPLTAVLLRHARSRTQEVGADRVLAAMARDLRDADLAAVADQVRLALDAGLPLDRALERAAADLSERIQADVQKRLAAAPNTYIIPMVATVFGPLFLLTIVPLMVSVLKALQF